GEQSMLLSLVELLMQKVNEQGALIQELRDDINRLKGEQGKPNISGKNQKERESKLGDISSEKERKQKSRHRKRRVKFDSSRRIDVTKKTDIADKSSLPADIVFKGYAKTHYQHLEINTQLIELQRAIYYSPSRNQTYTANYPNDYKSGDYSQDLKGHIIMLKSKFGMSIPQIGEFLRQNGIDITNGTISNIYISIGQSLKAESDLIHKKGIENGLYSQTDSTGSRVNGENHHSHIFTNAYFTSYFTTKHKDRQTVLDLLRSEVPRVYLLDETTYAIYAYLKIPKNIQQFLSTLKLKTVLNQVDFEAQIKGVLAEQDYLRHQAKVLEGAYLAAYQADTPVTILVADDAPQYKLCALSIALCWVHIGRNFKKINPTIKHHQTLLEVFLNQFWIFYHRLKDYKQNPEPLIARQLQADFDTIFSQKTGFELLNQQIAKVKAKKRELLVVLTHPYVPLHNNDAELAARKEIRYRDISFQTRTQRGTQAKNTFFTIIQTAQKLGLNSYEYILDRIKRKSTMLSLDKFVLEKMKIDF
ncbi:MAG: hypothetical protein ACI920_003859, partial [Saprospiraceae bacterium]